MTRYDLISPRERKDGKTYWAKVGAAFPRDNGGFSLVFDALPLPDKDGQVRLLMTEARPRESQGGGQDRHDGGGYSTQRPAAQGNVDNGGAYDDMADEIPF